MWLILEAIAISSGTSFFQFSSILFSCHGKTQPGVIGLERDRAIFLSPWIFHVKKDAGLFQSINDDERNI